jgi:glutamate-1-semialdehyde 2,1-aminomutase
MRVLSMSEHGDLTFPAVNGQRADAAVRDAHARYGDRRPNSAAQAAAAASVLPAGSTRSVLDFEPFPFRVERAVGAELFDVDGNRLVDFLGDYTAGLLGHNPPEVAEAVRSALDRGWSLGALASQEHRLAELLCGRFPSIEQIRFTNSGTEANLMAISLARHLTGRSKVAVFDGAYHGGLLYFGAGGAAIQAPYDYVTCTYNDADSVAAALSEHGSDIACLLVEPMMGAGGCIPAAPGFLEAVREHCTANGVMLIFDEVMTSRMSSGGAQLRFGVHPDLTTLGKYLGGGMTFGAFGGPADAMAAFDPKRGGSLTHGGTFNNNVMTMTAGVAAVEHLLTPAALDELFDAGEAFRHEVNDLLRPAGLSAIGLGSLLSIHAAQGLIRRPSDLAPMDGRVGELLFHAMLERGFYMARRGFIALSLAVTDRHRQDFLAALAESLVTLVDDGVLA